MTATETTPLASRRSGQPRGPSRRVRLPWLYVYRAGFGVYDGAGIALSEVESDRRSVGSTVVYGYQELEFALSRLVFLIGRVQLGVHDGGLVGGAQARMRIWVERYTNLVIGGDVLSEVGQRAFFALNFSPTRRLPMVAQASGVDAKCGYQFISVIQSGI